MKLFEITGVKKYHKFTEWQLKKLMRRMGITMANGKYGLVLMHPKWNYVVKIFNDGPYLDFVDYAIKHPNKHFPKFTRKPLEMHAFHTRAVNDHNRFFIVKIEKLNEITDKKLLKSIVQELELFTYFNEEAMNNKSPNYGHLRPDGEYRVNYSLADLGRDFPWFKTLGEAYKHFLTSEHATGSPDIHASNFMQRDDGTIVFIDPQWVGTNPMQDYYNALQSERDTEYEDPVMTSGPRYQHHVDAEKKAKEEERQKWLTRHLAKDFDINVDDDIPF